MKKLVLYIFSSASASILSFIMIPIYTSVISVKEYGIYGVVSILIAVCSTFISGNLFSLFQKKYFKRGVDRLTLLATLLAYYCIVTLGFFILFLFFVNDLLIYLNIQEVGLLVYIILIVSFTNSIIQLYLHILILQGQAGEYVVLYLGKAILHAVFGAIGVLACGYSWKGLLFSSFIVDIIAILYIFYKTRKVYTVSYSNFSINNLKQYFVFYIEILPTTLNWRIITFADRIFISRMVGVSSVGLYTLGSQLSNTLGLFTSSFDKIWGPFFMKEMNKETVNHLRIIRYLVVYIVFLFVLIVFIYMLFPYIVRYFFNYSYLASVEYFNYFLLVVFFSSLHSVLSKYLIFYDETKKISIATFVGMVLNLILNYFLISSNGGVGAAQATFLSYVSIIILEIYFIIHYLRYNNV